MNYSRASYELILQTAISHGFEFVDFSTMDFSATQRRQLILRHDIDTSLAMAHEAAKVDAKYKVRATFALQLSSPLYNPFTATSIKTINEIHQLGHNIVLHYRITSERADEEIRQNIVREMQVMRAFFPYIQPILVWHNLSLNNGARDLEIPGMVNVCTTSFAKKLYYISDSILRHKAEDFLAVLDKYTSIQMLFHPTVWMSGKNDIVPMFTHVLCNIIRECDHEFALNSAWAEKFPYGISGKSLNKIEEILND